MFGLAAAPEIAIAVPSEMGRLYRSSPPPYSSDERYPSRGPPHPHSGFRGKPSSCTRFSPGWRRPVEAARLTLRETLRWPKPKITRQQRGGFSMMVKDLTGRSDTQHGDRTALTAELQEYVKQRIGVWKYPRWIEFPDNLPKTATGKIQRFKLRQTE